MRTEFQMLNLITGVACSDRRIYAAVLVGSRADKSVKKDIYQDYDIEFYVGDLSPFRDNLEWLESNFGKTILVKTSDSSDLPDTENKFTFLAIFDDGVRINLSIISSCPDRSIGEPFVILTDKKGLLSDSVSDSFSFNVRQPEQAEFTNCCNEFWWSLNDVAKGIKCGDVTYSLDMMHACVKPMLDKMVSWYIGTITDFSVGTGKSGKYFEKYLHESLYKKYLMIYSRPEPRRIYSAMIEICKLFSDLARIVSSDISLEYDRSYEDGLRMYLAVLDPMSK